VPRRRRPGSLTQRAAPSPPRSTSSSPSRACPHRGTRRGSSGKPVEPSTGQRPGVPVRKPPPHGATPVAAMSRQHHLVEWSGHRQPVASVTIPGSARARTALPSPGADALLAVSGGSFASTASLPPSIPHRNRPTATLRRRTRTRQSSQPTLKRMRAVPADQLPDQDRPRTWWGNGSWPALRWQRSCPPNCARITAWQRARSPPLSCPPGTWVMASPSTCLPLSACCHHLGSLPRSPAGLPGEVSGVALVLAAPACGTRQVAAVAVTAARGRRRQPVPGIARPGPAALGISKLVPVAGRPVPVECQ
jgi:hypothetical protein